MYMFYFFTLETYDKVQSRLEKAIPVALSYEKPIGYY